jgi:hypothetical protein
VVFTMRFRGMREMFHTDLGMEVMRAIAEDLTDVGKVENAARREGRRITMLIAPLPEAQRKQAARRAAPEPAPDAAPKAEATVEAPAPAPETPAASGPEDGPPAEAKDVQQQ